MLDLDRHTRLDRAVDIGRPAGHHRPGRPVVVERCGHHLGLVGGERASVGHRGSRVGELARGRCSGIRTEQRGRSAAWRGRVLVGHVLLLIRVPAVDADRRRAQARRAHRELLQPVPEGEGRGQRAELELGDHQCRAVVDVPREAEPVGDHVEKREIGTGLQQVFHGQGGGVDLRSQAVPARDLLQHLGIGAVEVGGHLGAAGKLVGRVVGDDGEFRRGPPVLLQVDSRHGAFEQRAGARFRDGDLGAQGEGVAGRQGEPEVAESQRGPSHQSGGALDAHRHQLVEDIGLERGALSLDGRRDRADPGTRHQESSRGMDSSDPGRMANGSSMLFAVARERQRVASP